MALPRVVAAVLMVALATMVVTSAAVK
jgi:hypothetical protein